MIRSMKDSRIKWIGEIPESWDVVAIQRNFDEIKEINENMQCVIPLQYKYGKIIRKQENNCSEQKSIYTKYLLVKANDIMINGLNLSFDFITQRVARVEEDGIITSTYIALRPKATVDSRYATFLFKSYDGCKALHSMGRGLRSILSFNEFKKYNMPYPPLAEQKKIVDFLDGKCAEIDELVQTEEKMIEELKAYKQSVITEAVTKGLNPSAPMKDSGIEWIGEIPENWEVLSLKRLISARRGGAWGDDAANNYGDRICLRVADFNYDGLCIKEGDKTIRNYNPQTIKNLRLGSNDLLIEKSGGGEKTPVGRCVLPTGYEGCLYANFIDKLVIKAKCHRKYVTYLMYVAYLNGVNIPHIKQTTGIQNLDVERYLSERVVSPSFDEQKKIADFLDEKCAKIDEIIALRNEQINQLKDYKKSLIYEYVTGKKEVV